MLCIYCGLALDNSDEHILQQGFGSTLSATTIICSACNALFSNTLDSHCVSRFDLIYNQLGVSGKSKKGKDSVGARSVILEKPDGRKVLIDKDQRVATQDKPLVTKRYDEQGNIMGFELSGTDWSALSAVVKSIKKGLKKGQSLSLVSKPRVTRERTPQLVSKTSFDNLYFKGIKKSILNFIAYHDRAILGDSDLMQNVRDVYDCAKMAQAQCDAAIPDEPVQPLFSVEKAAILTFVQNHAEARDICHVLLVSCNREDHSIIGVAVLFGQFVHGYLLSARFEGNSETFFYLHSPLSEGQQKTHLASVQEALFGREDLRNIALSDKRVEEHVIEAYKQLSPYMWEMSQREVIGQKIANVFAPLPYPKGLIADCEEEIVDAITRFFETLVNIEYGGMLAGDPMLESELRSILEGASRKLFVALGRQHGHRTMDKDTVMNIGVNLFKAFRDIVAPLLSPLMGQLKNRERT